VRESFRLLKDRDHLPERLRADVPLTCRSSASA
jgi:hypothetical protein